MLKPLLLVCLSTIVHTPTDVALVCPEPFRDAMAPWIAHRSAQGYRVLTVSSADSPKAIRDRILSLHEKDGLAAVVLVGDAEPGCRRDAALRARCVPTFYERAEVNVLWGSEPHLSTDNPYADVDGDGLPDVPLGRLAADSPVELREIVRKTLAHERSTDFGIWRRRLNVIAGVGGFGPLADLVLESTARYLLTSNVPPQYDVTMTYASWRSPYCPDPRLFHRTTVERLTEGCWIWVYLGHGFHLGLDRVRVPQADYHILHRSDVPRLRCRHTPPVALFLACYTGAFDATEDCLAEEMLRAPGGPVAILAGSRVTMPYGMAVLGTQLTEACFESRTPTLGAAVLRAKRRLGREATGDDAVRKMLDGVAAALSPNAEKLAEERLEHVKLFNLFGDPLLRMRLPRPLEVRAPPAVQPGGDVELAAESPIGGRLTAELVLRRDRVRPGVVGRQKYPESSGALAELQEVYRAANDRRIATAERLVGAGPFRVSLKVPEEARGQCLVRVFVEGDEGFAAGASPVQIERR
jgi:hypothetical protein